jgi:hypothetical protein
VASLLDERGAKRSVQLGAARDVDLGRRAGGVDDLRERDIDPGGLEGAAELDGAVGERARSSTWCVVPDRGTVAKRCPPDKA